MILDKLTGKVTVEGADLPWPEGERRRLQVRLRNRSSARWLAGERPNGGVAFEVRLLMGEKEKPISVQWIGLPFDLEPGEEHNFEFWLRRPFGPVRLHILPHVFGHRSFDEDDAPAWKQRI
jgi:hypothetical protein